MKSDKVYFQDGLRKETVTFCLQLETFLVKYRLREAHQIDI